MSKEVSKAEFDQLTYNLVVTSSERYSSDHYKEHYGIGCGPYRALLAWISTENGDKRYFVTDAFYNFMEKEGK